MNQLRAYSAKALAYLKAHRWARAAVIVLGVVLALSIVLHPHGTKTFLVIGMDNYGSPTEEGRSDVTMLVQVDFTRSKISAATFARDMFVENEKGSLSKLNTVIRYNDEATLVEAMERNFGVSIDGWFRVNFTTLIQLVDAIGGAEVELTAEEVRYLLGKGMDVYTDYPLAEGKCRLNGAQALAYARCRKLDNDLGRGERQNKLIAAMVKQTRRLTAAHIANVFASLKHAWTSDLSLGEQAGLVFKALWLRGATVERIGVPFEGEWRYGEARGTSGIVANLENNRNLLLEALGRPTPAPAAQ